MSRRWTFLCAIVGLGLSACGPSNPGVAGSPERVDSLPIPGTIFTIVFENHGAGDVLNPDNPTFSALADRYAVGGAYLTHVHPSLPNYLAMTSGSTQNVGDDSGPEQHPIAGEENLGAQLDAADVPWRAYMEGMGEPCRMEPFGEYAVKHNPFVYYTSLSGDQARCRERIVDMDEHLDEDLASDAYRFMWITPDICDDMHDCPASASDQWLAEIMPRLMNSPGYRAGGAIFLMWDEGGADYTYVVGGDQNVPFILVSDNLAYDGFVSNTTYGHDSYLATVEDVLGLPRLPTTMASTPMSDFFTGAAPISSTAR